MGITVYSRRCTPLYHILTPKTTLALQNLQPLPPHRVSAGPSTGTSAMAMAPTAMLSSDLLNFNAGDPALLARYRADVKIQHSALLKYLLVGVEKCSCE